MQLNRYISSATEILKKAGIETAQLDVEILVSSEIGKDRGWIKAHLDTYLSQLQIRNLDQKISKRSRHTPIAYILGSKEFFGRDFRVTTNTLIPRPETEAIVELFFEQFENPRLRTGESNTNIVDIGTGSGCIIISIALELLKNSKLNSQNYSFRGYDISKSALSVAKDNADKYNANVNFDHYDLLQDSLSLVIESQTTNIIIANLPYVPTDFTINESAKHEPKNAIFGGKDGLDYYRKLFNEIDNINNKPVSVITESLEFQHDELSKIAFEKGYYFSAKKGLIQNYNRL